VKPTDSFDVLTLPGYDSSGPQHWQTFWEKRHGFVRVEQTDWLNPQLETWGAAIDRAIGACAKPALLVAHSCSASLVPMWAATSPNAGRVAGAFLVAPADTQRDDMIPVVAALGAMPRERLPFSSMVVASTNDPYSSLERARLFARDWGSELIVLEGLGHINSASNLGEWLEGLALLESFAERIKP
jgi:uncharacterized protein